MTEECDRIPPRTSGSGAAEVNAGAVGGSGAGGIRRPGGGGRKAAPLSRTSVRLLFLIPGGLAMLAGLDAALLLLGVWAPVINQRLPVVHGPVMVFGFIGTVISLERAVAIRTVWGFGSPLLFGLGGIILVTPAPIVIGQAMLAGGAAVLIGIYAAIWKRQAMLSSAVQALGAWLALASLILWLGGLPASSLVPGMTGYIVLTIAGERIELARLMKMSKGTELAAFTVSIVLAAGVLLAMLWPAIGFPIFGASIIAFVVWLMKFDVATRLFTGSKGLPRYVAGCLLAGYFWLVVAGLIWLFVGQTTQGPWYDGAVHSVFLGFTVGMIMAHAPIILPAVLRKPLPYRPMMIAPVVLLNLSLIVRVLVGDTQNLAVWVQVGGVLGVIALLLFVATAVASALMGPPKNAQKAMRMPKRPAPAAPKEPEVPGELGAPGVRVVERSRDAGSGAGPAAGSGANPAAGTGASPAADEAGGAEPHREAR